MGLDRASWRDLGNRPLFFPAAGLAFGASLELQTTVNARVFHGAAAFLALLGFLFARRPGAHLSVLAASVLIGVGLARMESATEIPDPLPLDSVRVEGVIEAVTTSADSTRLEIAVSRVLTPTDSPARFRIGVYALGAIPPLYAGQRILVPAHLKPQEATANPGQWDISGYRTRHAFLFTGSFDPRRLVVLSPPTPWRVWLANVQRELAARAKELAPSDQAAALYLTMAAGLRADLGPDLENRFALSGLAHVLSVSGLHVAALALLTLRSIRIALVRLWRGAGRSDARKWAGPLSVPLIWAYVIFTGNQPPAVRSAVMASSILAAMAIWSRADALNSLALASAALLIADPAAIADLSLQLSFMAVLSLILLSPAVRQLIPIALTHPDTQVGWRLRLHRILEEALQTLSASAAVILAGTPLIASAFHRVSLVGLVSNIVCLPLCGLLTALAAGGAGAFVLLPWAAVPFLWAGGWASQLLLWLADFFASLPGAAAPIPSFGAWQCALFFLGLFVFAIGEGRWRWVGLAAPVALLWVLAPWGTSVAGMRITFLSVGHGDAIVISSGRSHALIDGGGTPSGADTGRKYVLPYLREHRVGRLDLAVLSHPHPDHALGLISTLSEISTQRLWLAAGTRGGDLSRRVEEAARGAKVEEVEVGQAPYALGNAQIEVLGPPSDRVLLKGVNDRSAVLLVRHGQITALLTGDIEEAGEEYLNVGPTTILKVPHHGSATSSTPQLLRKVRPRYVVFCVGKGNRFHLPNQAVVRRYASSGARCFRTDIDGAVTFESDGEDVRWKTFHPRPLPSSASADMIEPDDPGRLRPGAGNRGAEDDAGFR